MGHKFGADCGAAMTPYGFDDLDWFLVLAKERSFTRAAARLGVAQSTLSHTIKRIETRMGLRLVSRTTRSVALTEPGQRLFETLEPRLEAIKAEIDALVAARDNLSGTVRLTLSDHALDWFVQPKLGPLLRDHPNLKVELFTDSSLRDIVRDGFDAGIRLGESLEKDMIAVRVSPDWRLVVIGAPDYLARRDTPLHPRDLIGHACVNFRHSASGAVYAWEFSKNGEDLRVRVEGQLTFNSSRAAAQAAADGLGLAFVPEDQAKPIVDAGLVVTVLEDWCQHFPGYFLYYPSRSRNSAAFTAVMNALRGR
jgi:DNA-binding transcriptional LysR family regulator